MQLGHVFAMAGNALVNQFVVGVNGIEQLHAFAAHHVHGGHQVAAAQSNVLNAFAVVFVQVLLNLASFFVALFIDGDADFAART